MRQSKAGRRAQMADELGSMVADGKLKRVDDSNPPAPKVVEDEHVSISVSFTEPPPRLPSPVYIAPPIQVTHTVIPAASN